LGDAERRLASYRPRLGEVFAFGAELALKRDELDLIEQDLASDGQINDIGDVVAAATRRRHRFRVSMKVAMPVETCGGRKNGRHQISTAHFA
jgi:hypothetical protein